MLSVLKNSVFGSALHNAGRIQQKELDWYLSNYGIIASQAAVLAGFSSQSLCQTKESPNPYYMLETVKICLTVLALMAEIYVIVTATFCSIWGPCLALRGTHGIASARKAIDILNKLLFNILATFVLGLFSLIMSSLISVLVSTRNEKTVNRSLLLMALTMLVILGITANTMRIFYYSRSCNASVNMFHPGETIGDLDNLAGTCNDVTFDN